MEILKVLFAVVAVAGVVYAGVLLAQFALRRQLRPGRELTGANAVADGFHQLVVKRDRAFLVEHCHLPCCRASTPGIGG